MLRIATLDGEAGRTCHRNLVIAAIVIPIRAAFSYNILRTYAGGVVSALCGNKLDLASEIASYLIMLLANAWLEAKARYHINEAARNVVKGIVSSLQRRALSGGAFFRLMHPEDLHLPQIVDPLQRISEVPDMIFTATDALAQALSVSVTAAVCGVPIVVGGGGLKAMSILAASLGLCRFLQAIAPDWPTMNKEYIRLDSQLQRLHTRLRNYCEPVAFTGGGAAECQLIDDRLEKCCSRRLMYWKSEWVYQSVRLVTTQQDYFPMSVTNYVNAAFQSTNQPVHPEGHFTPMSFGVQRIYDDVVMWTLNSLRMIVQCIPVLQGLDGATRRLLEFVVALEAAEAAALAKGNRVAQSSADPHVMLVQGLDLVPPSGGTRLAEGIGFELQKGQPMCITGPSGCGKSLLGLALLGLVRAGPRARIDMPALSADCSGRPDLDVLTPVPQRPYMPSGSLGDQICYPRRYEPSAGGDLERRMEEALRVVGVAHLLAREDRGWLATRAWEEVLSGGEQQRLGFARLLLRKPCFALLDECTSMVASDAEAGMYQAIVAAGITPQDRKSVV